jgi:hypothetical protein
VSLLRVRLLALELRYAYMQVYGIVTNPSCALGSDVAVALALAG